MINDQAQVLFVAGKELEKKTVGVLWGKVRRKVEFVVLLTFSEYSGIGRLMTREEAVKIHSNHSQRAKPRGDGDRKVTFKGFLDNPHRISW